MIARVRELDIANERVHGGNRRPEPEFVVDPAALAEFNAGTQRAIEANRLRKWRERELDRLEAARWVE